MDPEVIFAKIESLHRCAARIEAKKPVSRRDLAEDIDSQDIIVLNIERAVQLCVDAGSHILADLDGPSPSTMSEVFQRLGTEGILDPELASRLVKAVGFRNIAVHQYRELDWDIVYSIAATGYEDFRHFAEQILTFVENRRA